MGNSEILSAAATKPSPYELSRFHLAFFRRFHAGRALNRKFGLLCFTEEKKPLPIGNHGEAVRDAMVIIH